MPTAKETYFKLRTEGADHEKAVRFARIKNPATARAYKAEFAKGPRRVPGRSADDLKLFWAYRELVQQFVEPYLAGQMSLDEVHGALYDLKYPEDQPKKDEWIPKQLCPHCGKPDCTIKHTYPSYPVPPAPQREGYMDWQAKRWVSPNEPPPIIYEPHKLTPDEMRNPSDELEQRSRHAAMQYNIIHGGTPLTDRDAAAMADQPITAPIAVPYMKPTIDDPHQITGLEHKGRPMLDVMKEIWQGENETEREARAKKRIQEMRAQDAERRRERNVLEGRFGFGWLQKTP